MLGSCANTTIVETTEECLFGCSNGACTPSVCGNNVTEGNETCDDGNSNNNDSCTTSCTTAACGDLFVQPPEDCDDGNSNDTDSCSNSCTANCVDSDNDTVCDPSDNCPDSEPREPVNVQGCDPWQFCETAYCGLDCFAKDFIAIGDISENTTTPYDCTVVLLEAEGSFIPACVPLECQAP
ncbi:MAG TPA: DUF4215 domain-containing protein [Candidatus Nanoarchaeia archaeon]|nr:DUF4215 domain-containing protein [Candidatus Nanoarchaeia archaeon]